MIERKNNNFDARALATALAHNQMSDEYDNLADNWYPWLFSQVHQFIARNLSDEATETKRAFDVGCGTGFQSYLFARAGYEVRSIDIAEQLLQVARKKITTHAVPPLDAPPLFDSSKSEEWLKQHHAQLAQRLDQLRSGRAVVEPIFELGDLTSFEFGVEQANVISCCGSVLSFVSDYASAITKLSEAVKPGGLVFLEVEQKRNLDLVWPILDNLLNGKLGYEQEYKEIFHNLLFSQGKSVQLNYPFQLHTGEDLILPIWLFSVHELARIFRKSGLRIIDRIGIHQVTNLLPSPLLHKPNLPPKHLANKLFSALRPIDAVLSNRWPFWQLGCSVLYCLQSDT